MCINKFLYYRLVVNYFTRSKAVLHKLRFCYTIFMIRDFKAILASISTRGEGRLFLFDKEIFIFTNEQNDMWQISTKVSSKNHPEIREFSSYPFTVCGSIAIKDYAGRGVYFLYNVPPLERYTFFQDTIKNFLDEADSWSELLA